MSGDEYWEREVHKLEGQVDNLKDEVADLAQRLADTKRHLQWALDQLEPPEDVEHVTREYRDAYVAAQEASKMSNGYQEPTYEELRQRASELEVARCMRCVELEQRLAASESALKQEIGKREAVQVALDRTITGCAEYKGRTKHLERELAELRQCPHPEHDTCPCCVSNGQQEMREAFHKAMKKAGVQGLMIAKVFAILTGVKV